MEAFQHISVIDGTNGQVLHGKDSIVLTNILSLMHHRYRKLWRHPKTAIKLPTKNGERGKRVQWRASPGRCNGKPVFGVTRLVMRADAKL